MTHAPDVSPQAALWEEVKIILRHALQIFGEPSSLFEDRVLPRSEARRLGAWIAALEAAVRALLWVMAAGMRVAAPSRSEKARRAAAAPSKHSAPLAEDPPALDDPDASGDPFTSEELSAPPEPPGSERWARVVFRFAPAARQGARGARGPERRFLPARGLAFRLEALIRVAEAPEPYARRLARRLAREPALAARALRRPDARRPGPYDDLVEQALAAARAAVVPPPLESG